MTDMLPSFIFASLANRLGGSLWIDAEPWILFFNPVKIVKFISKNPTFLNGTGPRCGRFS